MPVPSKIQPAEIFYSFADGSSSVASGFFYHLKEYYFYEAIQMLNLCSLYYQNLHRQNFSTYLI